MSLRYGSSGLRLLGDRSKSRPAAAGAHRFFFAPMAVLPAQPWTISMAMRRCLADPATVPAHAVRAGTIASRTGSATVTPIPFRTARRERCFFVRNELMSAFLLENVIGPCRAGLLTAID